MRPGSTSSNRRIPEPKSAGESAIENSSIRPAFTYSRIVAPPPAMRTSRLPAAARAWSSAVSMPSLTKWKVVPPARFHGSRFSCVTTNTGVWNGVLRPRMLACLEHALAHHARAGTLERLARDIVVTALLATLAELQVLTEESQRERPLLQFHLLLP